ncbi:RrF2 family transcriptional regulator [Leptolyngbya sp. NIES-2104]|uniref:RrF2 family transcriptional regulator n=1 Tax=Leptolyngbya sp. NIES-2104 TaxID=1552121 RepID=UPI0006EC95CE|nr:Rrf2 family transcriptional regulator [Leptolyngbya sp. NIES-2104]GAP94158.1 predicted transcriptional regulator of cysteine synthase, Rrf2 family [Leptolyngbya sp. NIES-2104]
MQANFQMCTLLELSAKVEYTLLALLELASHLHHPYPLTAAAINEKHQIPERYLEQILATLRRGGLVHSHRGSKGGFVLAREPHEITLLDVVTLMDGERKQRNLDAASTVEREMIYKIWQENDLRSQQFLSTITLKDLRQQRDALLQANPMYYI